ncbi:YicC/YloC family endoribonuclease [uncultured Sphaerochaeta sp.]|uniref:YicC/YloC family endoribonuclease n=1 Tax=uncultured Sphaerochaeta sp. TaxID=886478 RepID=UPI002A0A67E7|nr:YicC/YloC family endoribonuclease [uncultured Sphaerochaeta sp.]
MKSMTGYGSAEVLNDTFQLSVEIKSYNNRFLDINHNIPFFLSPYEMDIDKAVSLIASRGHVEVNVRVKTFVSDMEIVVDSQAVERYRDAFAQVAALSGKALKPQLSDFLSAEGVITNVRQSDSEIYKGPLFTALDTALVQFGQSKEREGNSTRTDLLSMGKIVEEGLAVVTAHAGELEELVKTNLKNRFEEMLGDQHYDENRILQEVAVMLVKYSVNEEIKRLAIHLKEYFKLLDLKEPVGKRLDFLCQEMNREINTIGSKSQMVEMNLQVVRMKDGLENVREQIRNIE